MKNLQEVFNRIQKIKKEQKEIRSAYQNALKGSNTYQEIIEQIQIMQEKKKQIELDIKAEFIQELERLENLKQDLKSDMQLLTDIALTQLTQGKIMEIRDEYENQYEPIFSVKFKKIN